MVATWLDSVLMANIDSPDSTSQQTNWSGSEARSKYSSVLSPHTAPVSGHTMPQRCRNARCASGPACATWRA
jgi:hypothetical protein